MSGLYDSQIEKIMKTRFSSVKFQGVYSKNELPVCKDGYCMISNMQDSETTSGAPLPGTHWVACGRSGKENTQSWYFDSFGLPPPLEIKNAVSNPICYSTKQIQGKQSKNCGYYAMAVCFSMSSAREVSSKMNEFDDTFNAPVQENNDVILKSFFNTHKH